MRNNSFTLLVFEASILEDTPDSLDVTFGRSRGRLAGPPLVACSSCERASGGTCRLLFLGLLLPQPRHRSF